MSVASHDRTLRRERADEAAPARAGSMPIAGIDIHARIEDSAGDWRALEDSGVMTAYQRHDFLSLWWRHVGAREGIEPHVVVGRDAAGRPAFLWPLGVTKRGPFRIASFLGGKHANYNFGPWRRDIAAALDATAMRDLLRRAAAGRVDLFSLASQPHDWEGLANPFARLAHQPSPSFAWRTRLDPDPDRQIARFTSADARAKLRYRERKLSQIAGFRHRRVTDDAEVSVVLDRFFEQKAERMRLAGMANVFAEPGVEDFLRAACATRLGTPPIVCHVLETADEMLAMFAGVEDRQRFSGMFTSFTLSDRSKHSPGTVLLKEMVREFCVRGLRVFDLGVGEADYKRLFCDEPEPLFDSLLPASPAGHALAAAMALALTVKRRVKQSPRLWALARAVQRRATGRG